MNKDLENRNIISKLKSWLYHFFKKETPSQSSIDNSSISNTQNEKENSTKNFFEEYKEKSDRRQYLLNLQKKFESKMILEKDINSEDQKDLELLYMEQIDELKRNIRSVEYKIKKYS